MTMSDSAYGFRAARLIQPRGKHPQVSWRRWEATQGSTRDHYYHADSDLKGKGKARERGPRLRRLTDPILLALREVRSLRGPTVAGEEHVRGGIFGRAEYGNGQSACLWVFELRGGVDGGESVLKHLQFDGLTLVDESASPVRLDSLLPCAPHRRTTCGTCTHPLLINEAHVPASYLTDLTAIAPACIDTRTIARAWAVLTEAMVDTIAWEEGWLGERISAGCGSMNEMEQRLDTESGTVISYPTASLTPLSSGQLLLRLGGSAGQPMDRATQEEFESRAFTPEMGLYRLWPLRRNGWLFRNGELPEELCDLLVREFEAVLGPSWLAGLATGQEVVWASFWTSMSDGPVPLAGFQEGSSGVVTIWPLHLLAPPLGVELTLRSPPKTRRSSVAALPAVLPDAVGPIDAMLTTDWLIDQAQSMIGLWQEYTTRAPDPPTPPASPGDDWVKSLPPQLEQMDKLVGVEQHSDDDEDLFGSPSPGADDFDRMGNQQGDIGNAGPIAHDSVEAASSTLMSPSFHLGGDMRFAEPSHAGNPDAMVTEDDFDFFDAPADTPRPNNYDGLLDRGDGRMGPQLEEFAQCYDHEMEGGFDLDKLLLSRGMDQKATSQDLNLYELPAYDVPMYDADTKHTTEHRVEETFPGGTLESHKDESTFIDSILPTAADTLEGSPVQVLPTTPEEAIRRRLLDTLPSLLATAPDDSLPSLLRTYIPRRLWPVMQHGITPGSPAYHVATAPSRIGDGRVRNRKGLRSRLRKQEAVKAKHKAEIEKRLKLLWTPLQKNVDDVHAATSPSGLSPTLEDLGSASTPWEDDVSCSSSASSDDQSHDSLNDMTSIGVNVFSQSVSADMAFCCGINLTAGQSAHLERMYSGDSLQYVVDSDTFDVSRSREIVSSKDGDEIHLPWMSTAVQEDFGGVCWSPRAATLSFARLDGDGGVPTSFRPLDTPDILVGHDGNVMRLSATATQYWAQLQLEPWGGRRDIAVEYEQDELVMGKCQAVRELIARAYRDCNLGELLWECKRPSRTSERTKPSHPEQARPLVRFSDRGLSVQDSNGRPTLTWGSESQCQTPESVRRLAFKLYDAHGSTSAARQYGNGGPPFVLAQRDLFSRPIFTRVWPPPALDLLHSKRFLHVAYAVRGTKLEVICADGQGERFETRSMTLDDEPGKETPFVHLIWGFVKEFASRASIEWRMNIMLPGRASFEEVQAWHAFIAANLTMAHPPFTITLTLLRSEEASLFTIPTPPTTIPTLIQSSTRQYVFLPSKDDHGRLVCPETSAYIITPPGPDLHDEAFPRVESLHIILFGRSADATAAYTRMEHTKALAQNMRDMRALRMS